MKYVATLMMNTTPAWLALSHEERNAFNRDVVGPIFAKYAINVRLIDVEAFSGRCTDIALIEFDDMQHYYFLIEALRDSDLFAKPYFEIVDILLGIEGGFRMYEELG